jgi:surface antigen
MVVKKLMAAGLAVLMLSACASDPTVGQKATLGTLAGAVSGAAIGSAFGSGNGRLGAMAAGALIGGFLGNQLGARMDEADRAYYFNAQNQALNSGASTQWQNPQSGIYGSVEPGPVQVVNTQQCRDYMSTIYIDGQPQTARGTACRNPDGTWRPING